MALALALSPSPEHDPASDWGKAGFPARDTRASFQQLCLVQPQPYPSPKISPNLACVQSIACALFWDTTSDHFPTTFIPHPVPFGLLVLRHFFSGALHCLFGSFTPLALLFPFNKNFTKCSSVFFWWYNHISVTVTLSHIVPHFLLLFVFPFLSFETLP